MSRVIQDSDDELNDDSEVDVCQPVQKDASPKQSTSDASSTEALRRQIEAAHRAHLQSQSPMNDDQTPVTLDVNRQKWKMPADFDSNNTSSGDTTLKKIPITYGRKSMDILSSLPADQREDQNFSGRVSQSVRTTNGMEWMLEDTMREAYAQHNPNALFPEPSSTVPNATLTQQRVLEGVLAPALLGSDVDIGGVPFQPDASIPWSEYLKSPTNTGEHPRSSVQEPHVSQILPAAMSEPSPSEHPAPPKSQESLQESLMLVGSPSTQEIPLDVIDAHNITMFPNDEAQPKTTQPQATSSSTVHGYTQEKLPSSSRQSRKKRPSPGPTSDNDLADLGLPKQQYKPRPSRSRSLKVGTQESIDYSIRPEKATKASRRRKSTPATTSLANPLNTPDKVRQICEMGFTPSTSERASKHNNGDVTRTVDWLITNRVTDDELASYTSQMSKTGNHQGTADINTQRHDDGLHASNTGAKQPVATDIGATSDAVNHNTTSAATDIIAPIVDLRSPAKVRVVIPTKLPKAVVETSAAPETSHTKAKRRKTTSGQPEPTVTDDAVNGAKVEKKRGRGRPKKAAKASVSTEIVQDDDDEGSKEQARGSPLLSVDGNAQPTPVQHKVVEHTAIATTTKSDQGTKNFQPGGATTTTATPRFRPQSPVLPDRPVVEPITPERVKKLASREQSSNNKAKVPYRVGLSKRARIAPLLRTMKK